MGEYVEGPLVVPFIPAIETLPPKIHLEGDFSAGSKVNPYSPWSMVQTRFDQSLATATEMYTELKTYMETLEGIIEELRLTNAVDYNGVSVPITSTNIISPPVMGSTILPTAVLPVRIAPQSPTLQPAPIGPPLSNNVVAPIIQDSLIVPSISDNVGLPIIHDNLVGPGLHDALTAPPLREDLVVINLPTVPVFRGQIDTDFGSFDTLPPVQLPLPPIDMSNLLPGDLPEELTTAIDWFEQNYDTELYAPLFARLLNDLQHGASGIGGTIEQEIYDRAQARQNIEEAKLQTEIEEYFASTGFDLPTGAMAARLQEHANARAMRSLDLNGKIMIEQAELAQKNSQFVIEAARNLEGVLRDYASKKNDRSLDYAKAVAANAVSVYAEKLKGFIATLEAQKVYVQLQVENLRAVIEANKGAVEVFTAEAQVYGITVDAKAKKNAAITDVYKAEVTGYGVEVSGETDIIKARVQEQAEHNSSATDLYKAQVQEQESRNSAAVELYKAEVQEQGSINSVAADIYKARVQAQDSLNTATTEIFKAEVQKQSSNHSSQTEIFKAKVQAQDSINSANTELFKAEVGRFTAEVGAEADLFRAETTLFAAESSAGVEAYKAELAGTEAHNTVIVDSFKARVMGYGTQTQAISENQKNVLQSYALQIENADNELKAAIAQVDAVIRGYGAEYGLREKVAESMANIAMQAMASSYGAVNSSAGLSYNAGESTSESWSHGESRSDQYSHSESISTQQSVSIGNSLQEGHSYQHEVL